MDKVIVPLIVPSIKLLRADAVWVTIANWAEGLKEYYGESEIISGRLLYSIEDIRRRSFSRSFATITKSNSLKIRGLFPIKLVETFAKDCRWFLENEKPFSMNFNKYHNTPFVWQHHDLFQTKGIKLAKRLNVPSVLFVDAPYVWESRKWGISRIGWEWFAKSRGDAIPLRQADLILAVSQEVKDAVVDLGIDEARVLIAPCTVSERKVENYKNEEVRKKLGLSEDFVIGWVGSFRKFHCLDLLIDGFYQASFYSPQSKLLLIGDGPERHRIEDKVTKYGLNSKVIFVGNIPHIEVHKYIKCIDLAVLPSNLNQGFHYSPLKLREIFAAGVPVIASAVGEVKQIILSSGGGWIVPPGNSKAISDRIVEMSFDLENIKLAGTKANQYARDEMGIKKQIDMVQFWIDKNYNGQKMY